MTNSTTKTLYVGYDLGDGESLISFAEYEYNDGKNFIKTTKVRMPGENNPGIAIPTAYGFDETDAIKLGRGLALEEGLSKAFSNFKKQPSTLLQFLNEDTYKNDYADFFDETNPLWPESISTPELTMMKDHIVAFTNALFESKHVKDALNASTQNKDKIIFAIGHPTKWKDYKNNPFGELDIAIYKKIIKQTVLGNNPFILVNGRELASDCIFDSESRAAFLNAKEDYYSQNNTDEHFFDRGRVIFDVGSSTVDMTAYPKKGKAFNEGHTFLGARIIDYLILEEFFERKKTNGQYELVNNLLENNKDLFKQLLLACRNAKEECYSNTKMGHIDFRNFEEKINYSLLQELENKSIANILKKYLKLPEKLISSVGSNSWKEEFRSFLLKNKDKLLNDIKIEQIVLTGSASKMPFIRSICNEVFDTIPDIDLIIDNDPSACISQGLAMMGASREKSEAFRTRCNEFLIRRLPDIISTYYSADFAKELATIIYNVAIENVIKPTMEEWGNRKEKISKQEFRELLDERTSGKYFSNVLITNKDYKEKLNSLSNNISCDLNRNLSQLFIDNTDYDSMKVPIPVPGSNTLPTVDIDTINIDFASVMGVVSESISKFLLKGIVVATGIGLIWAEILATPIIATGGTLIFRKLDDWAEKIGDAVADVIEEHEKKIKLGGLARKLYFADLNKNIKRNFDKNVQKITDVLLQADKKKEMINSIKFAVEPLIKDAQNRIEYFIEDNAEDTTV